MFVKDVYPDVPLLANFDQPDDMTSCPVRPVSTHSLQALSLMNGSFMQDQSQALAARLERECAGNGGDIFHRISGRLLVTRFDALVEAVWQPLDAVARVARSSAHLQPFHEDDLAARRG